MFSHVENETEFNGTEDFEGAGRIALLLCAPFLAMIILGLVCLFGRSQ